MKSSAFGGSCLDAFARPFWAPARCAVGKPRELGPRDGPPQRVVVGQNEIARHALDVVRHAAQRRVRRRAVRAAEVGERVRAGHAFAQNAAVGQRNVPSRV